MIVLSVWLGPVAEQLLYCCCALDLFSVLLFMTHTHSVALTVRSLEQLLSHLQANRKKGSERSTTLVLLLRSKDSYI